MTALARSNRARVRLIRGLIMYTTNSHLLLLNFAFVSLKIIFNALLSLAGGVGIAWSIRCLIKKEMMTRDYLIIIFCMSSVINQIVMH